MKTKSSLKTTFHSLIAIFVIFVAFFTIPIPSSIHRTLFLFIAILGLVFLVQGIRLTLGAKKEKGKLKVFLMLTGISAVIPLPFSILHNVFYALGITFKNLEGLFEVLHAGFFIIALAVAPVTFIIGVVGSLILFKKSHSSF